VTLSLFTKGQFHISLEVETNEMDRIDMNEEFISCFDLCFA